jgi:Holliday junction resolvasome RuvABC endonuclease subunit
LAAIGVADPAKLLHKARIVSASDRYVERWDMMINQIEKFMEEFLMGRPVVVAVEQPNSFRGGETTRQLCGGFGALMYWLHKNGLTGIDVNTAHAKKVFCGKSLKGKQQTIDRANELYNLDLKYHRDPKKTDDDVADAIQVAWALRSDLIESDEWFREKAKKTS